jgi:predicted permease
VLNDLRLALRGLSKSPGFATIAIVTLALGIGASTAIFSVVSGVLLRSLPYPNPDGLMHVATVNQFGRSIRVSYPDYEDLRDGNGSFAEIAAYAGWTTSAATAGQAFRVEWAQVTSGFFPTLGVAPAMGRVFNDDEERSGQQVAVVSHGYWRNRLNDNGNFADQMVRVGDRDYPVIGVMPSGYDFPVGTELWVPREPATEGRTAHNWSVVGRLRDGVSPDRAQQDLSAIAQRIKEQYGDDTDMTDAAARPLLEQLVGNVRPALLVLLGAACILLLVACVNVANLLLARAFSRDRESALRLALGARPARLARAFLAESLLLSLFGAALGVFIAVAGVPALINLGPDLLPRVENIDVDWPVLGFTLGISVLVALTIGIVPAIRAARRDTREVLSGSRRIQGGSSGSRRLRSALVAFQIALTVVLLIGAGLLGRTVLELLAVDPGYRTEGALVMDVWLPYPDQGDPGLGAARIADFVEQLTARLRAIPGVERVGGINHFPLQGGGGSGNPLLLAAGADPPDAVHVRAARPVGRVEVFPGIEPETGHAEEAFHGERGHDLLEGSGGVELPDHAQ